MAIMDQLSQLLTRHQHLYNKEREVEISSIVSCHKYKSQFYGIKAMYDHKTRKNCLPMVTKSYFRLHSETVKVFLTSLMHMASPISFDLLDNSNM